MSKGKVLRMAMSKGMVVAPFIFDGGQALFVEKVGFSAAYMTGFGTAAKYGLPDVGLLTLTEMADNVRILANSADIPIIADADTGYGNYSNVMRTVQEYERAGAGALHLEDQVWPKRCGHMAGKEVIPAEEMAGKVRACAAVRDAKDKDFIINARTDVFAGMGLDEAIRRCNLYLKAGADLAFIDGIKTRADIEKAVKAVKGPLSVNLMDAITGMKTELIPIPELKKMGVGRVSIPVASIMVAHKALLSFFQALKASPTGILAGQTQWASSFEEYTDFVGLKEYRAMENEYLPCERVESKYKGQKKIVG